MQLQRGDALAAEEGDKRAHAERELEQQARDWVDGKEEVKQDIFGRQYIWNLFCHNSPMYEDNGYNQEEWKMVRRL